MSGAPAEKPLPAPFAPDFGITPELIAFVKREEGLVLKPYLCPAGFPTIGYGHRIPSLAQPAITKARAVELLAADLRVKRDLLLALSPSLVAASERRVAALVDFCFNCGEGAYKTSTLKKRVDAGDWAGAATEVKRWVHAAGKVFQPLVERRAVAAKWLVEG